MREFFESCDLLPGLTPDAFYIVSSFMAFFVEEKVGEGGGGRKAGIVTRKESV